MALVPAAVVEHYELMQYLQLKALNATRRAWARINPYRIKETWQHQVTRLEPLFAEYQERAAGSAVRSVQYSLAAQGTNTLALSTLNTEALAIVNTHALFDPAITALTAIKEGATPLDALRLARPQLDRTTKGMIRGASDDAAQIEIASHPDCKYVRMLNPPSCARCIQLAGRVYWWNQGFKRHPNCDCVHVATTIGAHAEAIANGLIDDPNLAFAMMDDAQIKALKKSLGKASVEALRAGADFSQVVNAKRGQKRADGSWNKNFTTEGMSSRGYARGLLKDGQRRATPGLLLEWSKGDRAEFQRLLQEHGYLLPEGTTLRGRDYEGFGQMGRGGRNKAASQAVLDARATGIRDPYSRYTMTAAERREYDSAMRDLAIKQGRNPYASPTLDAGQHKTPDPYGWRTVGGMGQQSAAGMGAPNLATGGTGGKPPSKPPTTFGGLEEPKWDGPHPPANARSQNPDYWAARQAATGINTTDKLEAREILHIERLQALGHPPVWIERSKTGAPTADYRLNGKDYELKSVDNARGIESKIRSDRYKAATHEKPLEKLFYIADLGQQAISNSDAAYYTYYNNIHADYPIKELFIMTNGGLQQIPLN